MACLWLMPAMHVDIRIILPFLVLTRSSSILLLKNMEGSPFFVVTYKDPKINPYSTYLDNKEFHLRLSCSQYHEWKVYFFSITIISLRLLFLHYCMSHKLSCLRNLLCKHVPLHSRFSDNLRMVFTCANDLTYIPCKKPHTDIYICMRLHYHLISFYFLRRSLFKLCFTN